MQGVREVEEKVAELAALVPDLQNKLGTMKADIMIALLEDTEVRTFSNSTINFFPDL